MNISKLVNIDHKEIKRETIIHYPEIKDLCSRSYKGHKNGCVNQDKCMMLNIPPFEIIDEYGDYNYYYLIYCKFNRKGYRKEIGKNDNIRWWQGKLKVLLKNEIEKIYLSNKKNNQIYIYGCGSGFNLFFQRTASMEHCCINVFSTMKLNGIKLEINPKNIVYLVCLLCSKNPIKFKYKNNKKESLNYWLK